jgi:ketosteroid isomerase-like protein
MTGRLDTERLLHQLYAARLGADLPGICATFTDDAEFQIAGANGASPTAIRAVGVGEFRPLLAIMVKTFKLSDQVILSTLIDGAKAAVNWRVNILSKLTGTTVLTEMVDVIEVRDGRIGSYKEFFVPR